MNNKKHGTGTYIEAGPNGGEYKGEWKNNKQHGKGFLKYNGMEYTGDFFEGKIQGQGILVDKDGKYEGAFLNGKMHGEGVLSLNNGRMFKGEFKNGKYVGVSRSTNNQLAQEQNIKKVEDEIITGNPELNSSSSGKFANLNPEQRAYCLDKLKRGKIKLDKSSNLYYELSLIHI